MEIYTYIFRKNDTKGVDTEWLNCVFIYLILATCHKICVVNSYLFSLQIAKEVIVFMHDI